MTLDSILSNFFKFLYNNKMPELVIEEIGSYCYTRCQGFVFSSKILAKLEFYSR